MKQIDAREFYRSQPGCKDIAIQIMGSQIIPIAIDNGETEILVQIRENGELGAIGGACNINVDEQMNLIGFEDEADNIKREFYEETGCELIETDWHYICNVISVNKYDSFPDVHGVGNYFYTYSTHEQLEKYAKTGSSEGKIVIVTLPELKQRIENGKVFSNSKPALKKLLQMF